MTAITIDRRSERRPSRPGAFRRRIGAVLAVGMVGVLSASPTAFAQSPPPADTVPQPNVARPKWEFRVKHGVPKRIVVHTTGSVRTRQFEVNFGAYAPSDRFPWLRQIGDGTAILGLDPTRSHLSARGLLPAEQLMMARDLVAEPSLRPRRLIVACHYPVVAPPTYAAELHPKRMRNADAVAGWLREIGPHLFCCGHVHAAWAFVPPSIPNQLCLNSGAPLLRDSTGGRPPGFLEIDLDDASVTVKHHAWVGEGWEVRPMFQAPGFFATATTAASLS